jgi:hypothetical protein
MGNDDIDPSNGSIDGEILAHMLAMSLTADTT